MNHIGAKIQLSEAKKESEGKQVTAPPILSCPEQRQPSNRQYASVFYAMRQITTHLVASNHTHLLSDSSMGQEPGHGLARFSAQDLTRLHFQLDLRVPVQAHWLLAEFSPLRL